VVITGEVDTRPCFLLAGRTGSGKTSLAQRFLSNKVVPDSEISHFEPATDCYRLYQNDSLRIWDSRGLENADTLDSAVLEFKALGIDEYRKNQGRDLPHVMLHCVLGPGARVTEFDINMMKKIPLASFALITKSDCTTERQINGMTARFVAGGIDSKNVIPCSSYTGEGVETIIDKVTEVLPTAVVMRADLLRVLHDAITNSSD